MLMLIPIPVLMKKLIKKVMDLVAGYEPTVMLFLRILKEVGTVVRIDSGDLIGVSLYHIYKGFYMTITYKSVCYSELN